MLAYRCGESVGIPVLARWAGVAVLLVCAWPSSAAADGLGVFVNNKSKMMGEDGHGMLTTAVVEAAQGVSQGGFPVRDPAFIERLVGWIPPIDRTRAGVLAIGQRIGAAQMLSVTYLDAMTGFHVVLEVLEVGSGRTLGMSKVVPIRDIAGGLGVLKEETAGVLRAALYPPEPTIAPGSGAGMMVGQCRNDMDCRAPRICEAGRCQEPPNRGSSVGRYSSGPSYQLRKARTSRSWAAVGTGLGFGFGVPFVIAGGILLSKDSTVPGGVLTGLGALELLIGIIEAGLLGHYSEKVRELENAEGLSRAFGEGGVGLAREPSRSATWVRTSAPQPFVLNLSGRF